ncbi:MAG: SIMPL domain-containing protein [Patescibacteria group bacterium]
MEGLPFEGQNGERLRWAVLAAVVLLAVFLGVQTVKGFMDMRYIGAGLQATNTINVSGYGEAFGAPDIATFSFSVVSEKTTVAAAQAEATAKINAITAYLKAAGVADKDVKTTDYSVYPQYDYKTDVCAAGYPCGGKQTLRGYEVRQTTTVKVRDTAKAGDLLTGVGEKGATEVSGLNFTFDDPNKLQNESREEAIADAKEKAELLAKQLGVRIVRVVSYSDSGNYPQPYYARDMAVGYGGTENQATKAVAPELSIGENKVTSNVTITYEIR